MSDSQRIPSDLSIQPLKKNTMSPGKIKKINCQGLRQPLRYAQKSDPRISPQTFLNIQFSGPYLYADNRLKNISPYF